MRCLPVGPGLDEATKVGPLENGKTRDKVAELVQSALDAGANPVTGGSAPDLSLLLHVGLRLSSFGHTGTSVSNNTEASSSGVCPTPRTRSGCSGGDRGAIQKYHLEQCRASSALRAVPHVAGQHRAPGVPSSGRMPYSATSAACRLSAEKHHPAHPGRARRAEMLEQPSQRDPHRHELDRRPRGHARPWRGRRPPRRGPSRQRRPRRG